MTRRPILGFGWAGVIAAAMLIALLALWCRGVNLRHHLMQAILDVGGIKPVYYFASVVLSAHHFAALTEPMFSLVTVCVLLPALHLSTRRGLGWRAALVVVWGVSGPVLWFECFANRLPIPDPLAGIVDPQVRASAYYALASAVVLWAATGSIVVAAVALAASAILQPMLQTNTTIPFATVYQFTIAWNAAVGAAALTVAWRERSRIRGPNECPTCGYDISGLAGPTCPECGRDKPPPLEEVA